MEEQVNWVPAIAVLVSGLIIGLIVVLLSRSKRESLPSEPEEETLDDLRERSDLLIRQLQEMESTSDPEVRRKVELEAAAVLRRIEEVRAESSARPPVVEEDDEEDVVAPAGGIPRFLWGLGTAVVVGAIVWFVVSYMSVRDESGMLTCSITASRKSACEISGSCCVETTTAEMPTGAPSRYSTLT